MRRAQARLASALTCAIVLSAAWPVHAADLSADDILAKARAAVSVTPPQSESEDWDVTVAGQRGELRERRHGDDTFTTETLGGFVTAYGNVHGQRWHQTENGITILDVPEPSQSEILQKRTAERVSTPLDAYLVTSTYASGHVIRTYYDPSTWLVERRERVVAGRTYFNIYEDFRKDERGRTRAWHYYGGTDHPEDAFDYRLRSDTFEDIPATDLEVPHNRRALVEFPAGFGRVELPARIERGRIYIRVTVGERGLDMLLDTGSAAITLNERIVRELGLEVYGHSSSATGTYDVGKVIVPELRVGQLVMHDVVVKTAPFDENESADTRVVGLLGFDFIAATLLRIDYARGSVAAFTPAAFSPPPETNAIPIRLNTQQPGITVSIGGVTDDDFILDTGAAAPFIILQRFFKPRPGDDRKNAADVVHAAGTTQTLAIVGGRGGSSIVSVDGIDLGKWKIGTSQGYLATDRNLFGTDNQDGLIGAGLLQLFTLYLDYADGKIFLERP